MREVKYTRSIKINASSSCGAKRAMHTCVLEMNAGLLKLVPVAGNPLERDWYVIHLDSKQLPQVAAAFEQFLRVYGQEQIQRVLKQTRTMRPASMKRAGGSSIAATARRK